VASGNGAEAEYEGSLTRDGETRLSCECRIPETNGLISDNWPPPEEPSP